MIRTFWRYAAMLAAAYFATASGQAVQAGEPHPAVAAIEQALAQPLELRAENQPLTELLTALAAERGISIIIDNVALEEAAVRPDVPVSVALSQVSMEAALRLILREKNLAFAIRDDVLLVTSADVGDTLVETRVYPVGDLVKVESANGEFPSGDFESLIIAVASIRPETWDEIGGRGGIRECEAGLSLVVSQTREMHRDIARLMADLRAAVAAHGLPSAQPTGADAAARIHSALDGNVSFACEQESLGDVLSRLARDAGVPLDFDCTGIDEAGALLEAPITLKLDDIRLRSALNVVLRGSGLAWMIRDEVLLITSADGVDNYEEVRVYPVADLVTFVGVEGEDAYDYESLIELITSIVSPQSWPENGQSMDAFEPGMALVLSQNPHVHEEIAQLLAELRKARGQQTELVAAVNARPPVDNETLVVRVYQVRAAGTTWAGGQQSPVPTAPPAGWEQELAASMEDLIEPQTWQAGGGEGMIRALPGALVVKQTRPIHRQIAALISLRRGASFGRGIRPS